MDNPKVSISLSAKGGMGAFAAQEIDSGELIASFDGQIYGPEQRVWTSDMIQHSVQFERWKFRDSKGIARLLNHSCEPNCGIRGLFDIVSMRVIYPGEELCWDYEMTEDSKWWRMRCQCGTSSCRKLIGTYKNLPQATRDRYRGYISEWLLREHGS